MKKEKLHEETLRLLVFVIGIFSICILLLTFKINVNAESPSNTFPYIVPQHSDLNTFYSSSALESAIYFYENNIINNVSVNSYFIYTDYGVINGSYYSFCFVCNPSVTSIITPSYDYTSNYISLRSNDVQVVRIMVNTSTNSIDATNALGYNVNLLGSVTTSSIGNGFYTPNYPFYMSGNDIIFSGTGESSSNIIVFTNTVPYTPDVFESGHAQEPSYDSDTIIDSSLHPNVKPTFPIPNTYNITNYVTPSIDTSTLETLLQSLIDVVIYNVSYLVSNIVGAIQNLWNNLGNILEYIGDLLSYLFNRVINTIKQTADNLYQNFKELFEPILNSFENFINMVNLLYSLGLEDDSFSFGTLFVNLFLPSEEDLSDFTGSMAEFDILGDVTTSITDMLYDIIDVLLDDSVYSFHIAPFTFCGVNIPAMEISFDWYLPYKSTGDIFISAFLIAGYLYWLWCRFAGIFHGITPDSQGAQHITVTDRSDQFSGFPY